MISLQLKIHATEESIQFLALDVATEGRKAANVRDEQPAQLQVPISRRVLCITSVLYPFKNGHRLPGE